MSDPTQTRRTIDWTAAMRFLRNERKTKLQAMNPEQQAKNYRQRLELHQRTQARLRGD